MDGVPPPPDIYLAYDELRLDPLSVNSMRDAPWLQNRQLAIKRSLSDQHPLDSARTVRSLRECHAMGELPAAGAEAPAFTLRARAGGSVTFGNREPPAQATLLFFFKHDCATCDLTAPLVERLNGALAAGGLRVMGVSQDAPAQTTGFVDRHELSFPVALDTELEVSAEYGFDAVPALVLARDARQVLCSFEGFVKRDLLELTRLAAAACGAPTPGDRA